MIRTFSCFIVLAALGTGCSNTSEMRKRAAALEPQVAQLRRDREARLRQLNEEYRRTFGELMQQFDLLTQHRRSQGFESDAQGNTDMILLDWEKRTVLSEFAATFSQTLERERRRIEEVQAAMVQARESYLSSYKEAALELAALKKVEANVNSFAGSEKLDKNTLKALKAIMDAVKERLEADVSKEEP